MPYLPDLDRLLTAGARYTAEATELVMEPHAAGEVVLPTGQVVGCDPLTVDDGCEPFTVRVPPGTYPLRAWVAVIQQDGAKSQRRVAALQLVVCDEAVVRWEQALVAGQDPSALNGDEFYGYGVDTATGTLADVAAIRGLAGWDYERLEDVYIFPDVQEGPVPRGVVAAVTDEATGANVIAISTGWGDGTYPTFIGYAETGKVSSFVTDFMVVPEDPSGPRA